MGILNSDEITLLQSLADRGDKLAEIVMRTFTMAEGQAKEMVVAKAATTANRTLSGLTNTNLDGVTPVAGDIILVKSQTSDLDNGLYKASAGAWTRLVDDAGKDMLSPGMLVSVLSGSTLAGTIWQCTATSTVVGTDHLTFAQFAGAGAVVTDATVPYTLGSATLGIGTEASHHIDVTIQLKDQGGTNLAHKTKATVWVSDTAGAAPSATAPDGGTAVQTGTALAEITADVLLDVISDATGVIVVRLTESTAKSFYVNVACGSIVASSAAVTFAG